MEVIIMVIKQRKTILAVLLGLAALTPMPAQAWFSAVGKFATASGAASIAAYLGYKSAPTSAKNAYGQAVGQGLGNASKAVDSFFKGVQKAPMPAPVAQPSISQEVIAQITSGVASGLKKSIGPVTQILVMSAVGLVTAYGIYHFCIKPLFNKITNFIKGCTNHLSDEHNEIQNAVEDVKEITTDTNAVTHRNEVTLKSVHAAVIDIHNVIVPQQRQQRNLQFLGQEQDNAPVDLS